MLVITDKDGSERVIRPVPFISITSNPIRNKIGTIGTYYDIILTGTILHDRELINTGYDIPGKNEVDVGEEMYQIVDYQSQLRELTTYDGLKYELLASNNEGEPILTFYPTVQSVNFEEGVYINHSKYTINLRAEALINKNNTVMFDSLVNSTYKKLKRDNGRFGEVQFNSTTDTLENIVNSQQGFIEDYSETWSLEVQEGQGITHTPAGGTFDFNNHFASVRGYILTRNITATGRTMYYANGKRGEAWHQAKKYIYNILFKDNDGDSTNDSTGYEQYPEYDIGNYFGSGYLNIANQTWGGYNHLRTESFDVTAGTFTLNDTWVLSSGNAYENYNLSTSKPRDGSNTYTVNIDGTIKGLSSQHAGGRSYGGNNTGTPVIPGGQSSLNSAYQNALFKWHQVSNSGTYGRCYLYHRAQSSILATLNTVPASVSVAGNETNGEITYNIEYDTRPPASISGTLSESITCNDTYPGDVFALIPVIGRPTGPIIQYLNSRTEYQRNLSIDLVFDRYYASGNGGNIGARQFYYLSKPSLQQPFRDQIGYIVNAFSPSGDVGIRKWLINPPVETWDASTGRYSLNINWIYELNK